jgi:hypothetical protein
MGVPQVHKEGSEHCFFEKKKQKTFAPGHCGAGNTGALPNAPIMGSEVRGLPPETRCRIDHCNEARIMSSSNAGLSGSTASIGLS